MKDLECPTCHAVYPNIGLDSYFIKMYQRCRPCSDEWLIQKDAERAAVAKLMYPNPRSWVEAGI